MLLALMTACQMGPSVETQVQELRVLATLAEPPEAAPGETVELETLVVDPSGSGFELLQWTCTFAGPSCLESAGATLWEGLELHDAPERWTPQTVTLSPALGPLASDEPAPLVLHWSLACAEGLCPLFDAIRSSPSPESEAGELIRSQLQDPSSMLAELPMEGVSLGLRSLLVSARSEGSRLQNPSVTCSSEEDLSAGAATGSAVLFTCAVRGEWTGLAGAWGYTTAGAWGGPSQSLSPGDEELEYEWFAPEEDEGQDQAEVWMIVVDGEGGVGVWEDAIPLGSD